MNCKAVVRAALVMVLGGGVALGQAAPQPIPLGGISGVVQYCDKGGVEGMQVYVPGRSFLLITDADGRFRFDYLPPGEYSVYYALSGKVVNRQHGVKVMDKQDTGLGNVAFCDQPAAGLAAVSCVAGDTRPDCVDQDRDGVPQVRDCDDTNAKTYPGALELCDAVDNNCNGVIDDVTDMPVVNGIAGCKAGQPYVQRCGKGFGDCDKKPDNGCETDLMRDNDNCGACGKACPRTDVCSLGSC